MNSIEIDRKVVELYKNAKMTPDEIISSLKRLLATAEWANLKQNKGE